MRAFAGRYIAKEKKSRRAAMQPAGRIEGEEPKAARDATTQYLVVTTHKVVARKFKELICIRAIN